MKQLDASGLRSREEIREEIPARLEDSEEFCLRLRRWLSALNLSGSFAIELLVREALNNAILHGCESDPAKRVTCTLRVRGSRLTIAVKDQGIGFDWKAKQRREVDLEASSGRGMCIYESYADRIRFGRQGNSVVMVKTLNKDCMR
jgi:serine/threonine-protein kinase RsbW